MSFQCPACDAAKALKIIQSFELPPDSRSDEIAFQIIQCSSCHFKGIAVYEESRRGALDSDSFTHMGYQVTGRDFDDLKKLVLACPNPRSRICSCNSHKKLGIQDPSGRWKGLSLFEIQAQFPLN